MLIAHEQMFGEAGRQAAELVLRCLYRLRYKKAVSGVGLAEPTIARPTSEL
jgi:hypothetical protein